jgi:hypothetical protein
MKEFSGDTDAEHEEKVASASRAYFSATAVRPGDEVWLRVETRWVAEGTPLRAVLFREEGGERRETVRELEGKMSAGEWEERWEASVPEGRIEEDPAPVALRFEARLDGHAAPARSQLLFVHRNRFST